MSRKLIERVGFDQAAPIMTAKVYRDTESEGYVVQFFKNGKHRPQADYETGDRNDALQTARLSIEMSRTAAGLPASWHIKLQDAIDKAQRDADAYCIPQVVFRGPETCGWTNLAFTSQTAGAPGVQLDRTVLPARYFQ